MALENQQHAAQNAGVDIPEADVAAPVEVDVDAGTVTEAPAASPPPARKADETPAARTMPRPQARIQSLTHERDEARGTADRLQRELAEARQAAATEKTARELAERSGMDNLVQRTKTEVVAAKAALVAAKDAGDNVAEVEAQARLSRAVAEEADADAWTAANPKQEPQVRQPEPQRQPPARQPEVQPLSGPVRDFISENGWFNPAQIGNDGRPVVDTNTGRIVSNPDFDEDLHDIAMLEHKRIAREVRLGRLPKDFVESTEYFQRIADKVRTEAPDAFETEEEEVPPAPRAKAPQMGASKQPVAPAARQVPGQQQQRQGTKMRLEGDEASLVRSLVDNGTMIYPRNHPDAGKRGTKMSYEDAYVKYAREKQNDQANRGS